MLNITHAYFSGDSESALSAQLKLSGFIKAIFSETNPTPIKYAMSLLSLCEADVRLPLYQPEEKTRELIRAEMRKLIF
jgi:4-hydroxy-tetrahydrodipicolinate synthase